jgi:hypothetical protein
MVLNIMLLIEGRSLDIGLFLAGENGHGEVFLV